MDHFTDAIIESVRVHECIYNKRHRDFKNIIEKEKAWMEVSDACDRPKEECRRKWLTLREKFSKEEKKNQELPSGSGITNEPEWAYFENMKFLKEFIQPRRTRKNTFDSNESLGTESDTLVQEDGVPPKKNRLDIFTETCQAVQKAAQQLNEEPVPAITTRRKTNEKFMSSICDLMEALSEEEQDSAMVEMLKYVADLRKQIHF